MHPEMSNGHAETGNGHVETGNGHAPAATQKESKAKSFFSSADKEHENITKALAVMKKVAAGDFEARITEITADGDLGELLNSINDLVDRCDAYVRESAACMEHVNEKQFFRLIIEKGMQGAFLNASRTVNAAINSMHKRVTDFAQIADDFESTAGTVVETVSSAATELQASSESMQQIANNTNDKAEIVKTAAEEATRTVETVAAAGDELATSISEISQQVDRATSITVDAKEITENLSKEVDELDQAANQIQSVMDLIDKIAKQTNLLALNATIEAARAGDAGRGFSVVANEVKSLAHQTSEATGEITSSVRNIQQATKHTIDGISSISSKVTEINEANTTVAAAAVEQTAATSEIARNMEGVLSRTQEVTSHIQDVSEQSKETLGSATEVNSAAGELSSQSEILRSIVSDFLVSVRKVV